MLLGIVAIVLIQRYLAFLVGTAVSKELRDAAGLALLNSPGVSRVTYLHIEYVGPNRLFLVAEVDLTGDDAEHDVARRLRDIERQIAEHELIEAVVLSLSVDDEPSLTFDPPTSSTASQMGENTASIERSMNTVVSLAMVIDMPSGSSACSRG